MPKHVLTAWIIGLGVVIVLFTIGTILNFSRHEASRPICDNWEVMKYKGCASSLDGSQYYSTGWPQEIYCFNDGKDSCTPWSDFLDTPRTLEKNGVLKRNIVIVIVGSLIPGLLVTSILLSRNQYRKK